MKIKKVFAKQMFRAKITALFLPRREIGFTGSTD